MGTVLLPLVVVLIAGLVVLGLIIAERYPVSTWKDGLRDLRDVARDKSEPMQVVPQDASLSEFITHEQATTYMGTESISGLVEVVEKAMDSAEKAVDSAEARTAALRGKAGHHPGRPSPSGSSPDPAGAPAQTVPAPVAPAPAPPLVQTDPAPVTEAVPAVAPVARESPVVREAAHTLSSPVLPLVSSTIWMGVAWRILARAASSTDSTLTRTVPP